MIGICQHPLLASPLRKPFSYLVIEVPKNFKDPTHDQKRQEQNLLGQKPGLLTLVWAGRVLIFLVGMTLTWHCVTSEPWRPWNVC